MEHRKHYQHDRLTILVIRGEKGGGGREGGGEGGEGGEKVGEGGGEGGEKERMEERK